MRLRHIEVFHAVMQAGTITGAAQILHISQPAVTKVLQHCELQLGLTLFDRVRGKLYPTPEAQRLRIEIDKLNKDLVSIRRLAANLRAGESEFLRLVCTPTLGASVMPKAIVEEKKEAKKPVDPNSYLRLGLNLPNVIKSNTFVIQKYIERPMLIKNRKFDIRVWCIATQTYDVYFFK